MTLLLFWSWNKKNHRFARIFLMAKWTVCVLCSVLIVLYDKHWSPILKSKKRIKKLFLINVRQCVMLVNSKTLMGAWMSVSE
jgi:hypothetical protein